MNDHWPYNLATNITNLAYMCMAWDLGYTSYPSTDLCKETSMYCIDPSGWAPGQGVPVPGMNRWYLP